MPHVNLDEVVPEADATDPEGFRALMARVGGRLGATESGASLYVLPPGQSTAPYHYEYGEEEWLLVLTGRPTIRTPEGSAAHAPMDLVFFPKGPAGAHRVTNDTADEVRVLMWSTVGVPSASAYPDSGKIAVHTGVAGEDVMVRRTSAVDYWDGEAGAGD
ncbi:cupin domain-containing protein [Patulibacter sp.]|uniref:cupin domain-containing protein n=1 Tax=Patulibacter sp. TaxID=1912859 RepID=UPI00271AFFDC|nr:cupin domain-containing protein [Patulibacter sp.]MDO9407394.1 cupin domain-containing protein [Patulibacter sp.]